MNKEKIEGMEATEAIKLEFETVLTANHPQITRVFQLLESDENLYIVMEYFVKGSLKDVVIAEEGFHEFTYIRVMNQVFKALQYLHETMHIIHRDIKPDNILVEDVREETDHRGAFQQKVDIKLTDFGLAIFSNREIEHHDVGTPDYQAPEILEGLEGTQKVDIWAAGVLAFQLFSGGHSPFPQYCEDEEEEEEATEE